MNEPEDFARPLPTSDPVLPANPAAPANPASPATPPASESTVPPLSALACAVGVFYRPRRVFQSLAQRPTWWVPLLLTLALISLFYFGSWSRIDAHQLIQKAQQRPNPQAWQLTSMPPAQRAKVEKVLIRTVRYSWIVGPLLILLYLGIESVFLFCLCRLAFRAEVGFWQVNAVVWHSGLPTLLWFLPLALKPFLGHALNSLQFKNLTYADLGYYFNPATTPKALYAIATSINFFTLWTICLLAIGIILVARTKRIHGVIAAILWWIFRWVVILFLFLLASMVVFAI